MIVDFEDSKRIEILSKEINPYSENIPDSSLLKILEAKTKVAYDVEPIPESFPLVLWSARNGTGIAQYLMNSWQAMAT